MERCFSPALLLAFPFALTVPASPQVAERAIDAEESKVRAVYPVPAALFGHAIALDGSLAVVGAPLDDNVAGNDAGSAYVFERREDGWTEIGLLLGSAGSAFDLQGESVDIDGDVIVVGSYLDDPLGLYAAGSAYVFVSCAGGWIEAARLQHLQPAAGDQFGFQVRVDGDTVAIGVPGDDTTHSNGGSVCVFEREDAGTPLNPCDDVWSLRAQILPSICQEGAWFGTCLALDGDRMVAGAPGEDSPDSDRGAAYVFDRAAGAWGETVRMIAPDGAIDDQFGGMVALDGDTLLVGAWVDDVLEPDQGSAYAFRMSSGAWSLEHKFTASDGARADYFGADLALSGDLAVIGAMGDDDAGDAGGSAYLFRRTTGGWIQEQKLTAHDGSGGEEFGCSVAVQDGIALVGSRRDDTTLPNSGSVFAFAVSTGNFARFGFGDGQGTACPCSNDSKLGLEQGCANSTGWGAKLSLAGSDSASADDLRFIGWNLLPANPALIFSAPSAIAGGDGITFGNGLLLAGGGIVRRKLVAPDQDGRAVWGPSLGIIDPWIPDTTLHFQAWYRDPFHGECGSASNLTNGVSVTFRP